MYTVVFLVTKRRGMTQQEFTDYWINQHSPLTARLPGLREYRCFPMDAPVGEATPPFDAVAYISFDDEQACQAALESEAFSIAVADGMNFQNVDLTYGFYAPEYRIV